MTVHALANGQPMCGRRGHPASWPPGERWVSAFDEKGGWAVDPAVSCPPCRDRVAARVAALVEAGASRPAPPRTRDGVLPPPAYVCSRCGRASWNPNDAKHRYCGGCGFEPEMAGGRARPAGLPLDQEWFALRKQGGQRGVLCVDLWYPRNEGMPDSIQVGLVDVRAADDLLVRYDFERDGWVVLQASRFSWSDDDTECDPDWQEVAFLKAWGREKKGEE